MLNGLCGALCDVPRRQPRALDLLLFGMYLFGQRLPLHTAGLRKRDGLIMFLIILAFTIFTFLSLFRQRPTRTRAVPRI